jgi:hypothetical protein
MQRFEIYNAEVQWHGCADMRPWLIVEIRSPGVLGCFPIASQCYDGNCFPIDSEGADFTATGLTKSCFIHDTHIIEIPVAQLRRYRGRLEGQLLADFLDFSGLC